jgi:uncharacterized protein
MENKKITILSIDGGGIRGILPGKIIAYIEEQIKHREGNDARISDYFDLIAGSSTGGILTCLYLTPNENNRPQFSATDAVNLYIDHGTEIFHLPWYRRMLNPFGLLKSKYSAKNLEQLASDYFVDSKLSDLLKPCLVTAYETFQRKTLFFNVMDTAKGPDRDYYIRDIVRSTSAAPTYFTPSKISSLEGNTLTLVDGGVFANNPAMCAYAEARTKPISNYLNRPDKPLNPDIDDMLIISIATGAKGEPYPYSKTSRWGVVGWLHPIIDILMSGNSETVHYQLNQMVQKNNPTEPSNYVRLTPSIGKAHHEMDKATKKNIEALIKAADNYIEENIGLLNSIVEILIENK